MNMCPRPLELNNEELAAARTNVAKFEPPHGWGSDKRNVEQLTTCELYSLIEWLRARNADLSLGKCRFNCRTAKENFMDGIDAGTKRAGDYYLGTPDREEMYANRKKKWLCAGLRSRVARNGRLPHPDVSRKAGLIGGSKRCLEKATREYREKVIRPGG